MGCEVESLPLVEGRVSVITATFNAAKTLQRCIESVRRQNYPDVEHVVMDGGSTDGTLQLLRENDENIFWKSERDRGIYDAWNKALQHASGEWVIFLGADDVLLPTAIDSYIRLLSKNPEADLLTSYVRRLEDDGRSRVIGKPWAWDEFQRYMTIAHVGSMHRRSLFSRLGKFDISYRLVGDYELLLRAGSDLRTAFMPEITAEMQAGGATDSFNSLYEARKAKVRTGQRNPALATVELFIAMTKLSCRRVGSTLNLKFF